MNIPDMIQIKTRPGAQEGTTVVEASLRIVSAATLDDRGIRRAKLDMVAIVERQLKREILQALSDYKLSPKRRGKDAAPTPAGEG